MDLKDEITIGALLGRTSHKMRLLLDKVFQKNKVDLNMEQFILLKFLECNDGANQQELSEILDRDKTTIARLINKMEKKSVLLRVNSKEDKRVKNIYITNLGKQVLEDILPFIKEIDKVLKSSISTEELSVLANVLGIITNEIKALEEKL
jgi:DNA-binding MarR family transcriptional regulator